jgi:glutathione S-transferase
MSANPDKLHYLRIPDGHGGRAEMVRMTYVLAGRPYEDVFHAFSDLATAVAGKNPFKQYPFVETASGDIIYQTLAIMHHAAHGTLAWPSDPAALTRALATAMGGYDLYQAFGGFAADDVVARQRFEQKRAPQLIGALGEIYRDRPFGAGATVTFADCIVRSTLGWLVRRNPVSKALIEGNPSLVAFMQRFDEIPAIHAFLERQAEARRLDNTV